MFVLVAGLFLLEHQKLVSSLRLCAIIPVYNHPTYLKVVVEELRAFGLPVMLIDDGSEKACARLIDDLVVEASKRSGPPLYLERHLSNQGKGAAIKTGLSAALKAGFSHGLQIDADGQHAMDDVPRFIKTMERHPAALIAGYPRYDHSIPRHRYYGRYASHVWVWINTLSMTIIDSMCGFRIYPLADSLALLKTTRIGTRMDFDGEFIVRWFWTNRPLQQLETRVIYPNNGISHFKLFEDNLRITWMHTKLFFGMLWRLPVLLPRMWMNKGVNDVPKV